MKHKLVRIKSEKDLIEYIKKKRKALGMTLEQLGDKVGLSAATIHCYENGTRRIPASFIFEISDYLSLDKP